MPATISESYLSRPFTLSRDNPGRELVYDVFGTEDEDEVETLLLATAPSAYQGRSLDSIAAEPVGGGVWKAHARYIRFTTGDEYEFDTTGGNQRLTQALSTIANYAPAGFTAPDFQGAIGVSEDRVEGVDVPAPAFQFSETHYFEDASVDLAYKLTLFNMTGRWNDDDFKGFASGECMFLGARGSKRGDEKWAINFRFQCAPNLADQVVGGITGIDKLGWDYLWVRYGSYEDSLAFTIVKRPTSAHVVRVALPGDLSLLGIGV